MRYWIGSLQIPMCEQPQCFSTKELGSSTI